MKKLLALVVLLACGSVWAQDVVRDSVPAAVADTAAIEEENVVGAKPTPKNVARHEANILGTPVYYDTNGNVIGSANPSAIYHRPKHHYLNNLDDRFCTFFAEGEVLNGSSDYALGINFSYLPKRWGAYGSLLCGAKHDYLSVGPVMRLSGYDSFLDWQLYGGVMFGGRSAGGEVGLRMAAPRHESEFGFMSASMGVAVVGSHAFVTFGASFDVIAVLGLTTLLLL